MRSNNRGPALVVLGLILMNSAALSAAGQTLSIYEIQSNTTDGDASVYHLDVVDVSEALVVAKFHRTVTRLLLLDTNHPEGWGGIQAKDMEGVGAYNDIEAGDRVLLTNMKVEEYRGTTFLQWDTTNNPSITVVSSGNPLPPPIMAAVSDIPAPIYDPAEDGWFVQNHDAELYESMRLVVRDLTITAGELGKASDNYSLENTAGDECWAADYLNADKPAWREYHVFSSADEDGQYAQVGRHFCALGGILEQYTNVADDYDYYQLLTLSTVDLALCGDGDSDGDVDLEDLPRFHACLTGPICATAEEPCDPPAWTEPPWNLGLQDCLMMDMDYDYQIDLVDFGGFQRVFGSSVD